MSNRALTFGSNAAGYDLHRPGYPEAIIERILDYAELPIRTALEVGAGTGKATRLIAAHKITVLASEPDERMLAVLQEQTAGLPVTPIVGTFEDLSIPELAGRVQLLYAAAAFHWTDPETRWDRTAAILPIGATAAFFGGELELTDPAVRARFNEAIGDRADHQAGVPMPGDSEGWQWPANELRLDARFGAVEQHHIPRPLRLSLEDFIGHIGTQSRFLIMDPAERRQTFDEVRSAMPEVIEFTADLTLHLARRISEA
ncbi:class I SAM-dependent methyltransferase [Microlunatus speluncae]|uniref:class I SAM-dependent methyltransferase n=1 Tax=Microlunatus speluncae TaxID=2594267 RepID=UPI0013763187|nr:class I SAM-dependent methyltransferase [Microlunatus speluncae]